MLSPPEAERVPRGGVHRFMRDQPDALIMAHVAHELRVIPKCEPVARRGFRRLVHDHFEPQRQRPEKDERRVEDQSGARLYHQALDIGKL